MRVMHDNADLYEIAKRMLMSGKGILAADESTGTMNKRLSSVEVEETPENRREYRELLFTAPEIENYISGVIMYDSSIRGCTADSVPFPDVLISRGIIPGIKVDLGTRPLEGFEGEVVTQGLDDLADRLTEYYELGARFTKWRAVITIDEGIPTDECLYANAMMLTRYAALAQSAGLVPIVEPEVIFHGTHDLNRAEVVTRRTLQILFETLMKYRVDLRAVILKSSMVLAGDQHPQQSSPEEVADATLRVFHLSVPHDVPGIVFLSGGQTPRRATENLNAIAKLGTQPWTLTFSYARALEEPVLAAWKGEEGNVPAAQAALLHRAKLNAAAQKGEYDVSDEES